MNNYFLRFISIFQPTQKYVQRNQKKYRQNTSNSYWKLNISPVLVACCYFNWTNFKDLWFARFINNFFLHTLSWYMIFWTLYILRSTHDNIMFYSTCQMHKSILFFWKNRLSAALICEKGKKSKIYSFLHPY